MEEELKSDQDSELIMMQDINLDPLSLAEVTPASWIIDLNEIETGMIFVSSNGSDGFVKYMTGSSLAEDLQDMTKKLEGDLDRV